MPAQIKSKAKPKYTLGQGQTGEVLHDLTCPSGGTCQVRRPGVQGLVKIGVLDSFDELTAIVKLEHFDRVDGKMGAAEVAAVAKDPKKVRAGLELMQKVVVHCIVQPKFRPVPVDIEDCERCRTRPDPACPDEHERDPDATYIDAVDLEDQAFILQYCLGGVSDLAGFRAQRAELLGNLPSVEGLRGDTESVPGDSGSTDSVLSRSSGGAVRPTSRKRAGQGGRSR